MRALLLALLLPACSVGEVCVEGEIGCSLDPCDNGVRDGAETDVDCGGVCGGCAASASCGEPADCQSGRCLDGLCCTPPCGTWTRTAGAAGVDYATGAIVVGDALVVAGQFAGTVDFGGGPRVAAGPAAVFVAAYALSDGAYRFDQVITGAGQVFGPVIAAASGDHVWIGAQYTGDSLVVGSETLVGNGYWNDGFLAELDGQGSVVRARVLGGSGDGFTFARLVEAGDGGVVALVSLGRIDFGDGTVIVTGGGVDGVVVRFDPLGSRIWSQRLGGPADDFPVALSVEGDSVFVGVNYRGAGSLAAMALPERPADGNFTIALAELGLDGVPRWARGFARGTWLNDVLADASGLYLAGVMVEKADLGLGAMLPGGTEDVLLARCDRANGAPLWARNAGNNDSVATSLALLGEGDLLVAGRYTGGLELGPDAAIDGGVDSLFLARLGADGVARWAAGLGGIVINAPLDLVSAPPDRALVLGGYAGTLDLDGAPATTYRSAGKYDVFASAFLP
jgi:hypothetical protein